MSYFKSEHGAASIVLLTALPFFIAVLCVSVALFMVLRTNTAAFQKCRVGLLSIENQRLAAMDKLLKMNPRARALQKMRENAEEGLRVAIESANPIAISAATTYRLLVVGQQLAFAAVQKSIITSANLQTKASLTKLKLDISSLHRQDASLYEGRSNALSEVRYDWTFLNIETVEKNTITPQYKAANDFESKQTLRLLWKFHPARLVPSWLGFLRNRFDDFDVDSKCLSTAEIRSGGKKWRARLAADKRWLNSSSSLGF